MNISACLTSNKQHYCTPARIVCPMNRLLIPPGSGRTLIDPATNSAAATGATFNALGEGDVDGLTARWSVADCWFNNPPYNNVEKWAEAQAYWGGDVGLPGMSLVKASLDTGWAQTILLPSADAICLIKGRLAFHLPIPLELNDADPVTGDEKPYFLRRWYPWATDDNLPAGYRSVSPGWAIGPELSKKPKPSFQFAPFPSMVCFWRDREHDDPMPISVEMLVEDDPSAPSVVRGRDGKWRMFTGYADGEDAETYSREVSEEFARAALREFGTQPVVEPVVEHPISIREFYRHFIGIGAIVVPRGPQRGVYPQRVVTT